MTPPQRPVGTPFSAASTTADVLDGLDLGGCEVLITGGHSRLGRAVTQALSDAGATVTVAARDPERAAAALESGGRPFSGRIEQLDLTDPTSVASLAERWLASGRPLDALVNNAAVLFSPDLRVDARGNEVQFSTSHLGHFQLTRGLLSALRQADGARVVTVTSGAARLGGIHWDDLNFASGYDPLAAYAQSKRANVLFTVELDRRHSDERIRAFAVHPGVVIGPGPFTADEVTTYQAQGLIDDNGVTIIDPAAGKKTIDQGAATIVFAATSPFLDGMGGLYLKDNDVAPIDDNPTRLTADRIPSDATTAMLDPNDAQRLWALSERLTT